MIFMMNKIYRDIERGNDVAIVYLDQSRAFAEYGMLDWSTNWNTWASLALYSTGSQIICLISEDHGKSWKRWCTKKLYEYCTENGILTWRNSGFKAKDSTINHMIFMMDKIYRDRERGNDVAIVYLDQSRAFAEYGMLDWSTNWNTWASLALYSTGSQIICLIVKFVSV